jgi:hypothetical protein
MIACIITTFVKTIEELFLREGVMFFKRGGNGFIDKNL